MKEKIVYFVILLFACSSTIAQEKKIISRGEAWSILQKSPNIYFAKSEVYVCDTVVNASRSLRSMGKNIISPSYDSWLFFLDDSPSANWEHPCRYIFMNVESGALEIYEDRFLHEWNEW